MNWTPKLGASLLILAIYEFMIILNIYGGIGNQMFQYAAGLSLSKKLKTELVLCTFPFRSDGLRSFALNHFNITNRLVTFDVSNANELRRFLYRLPLKLKVFKEKEAFVFDNKIRLIKEDCILDGSWQNELYFKEIRADLYSVFTAKKMSRGFVFVKSLISSKLSVSIHIKRSDFVTDSALQSNQQGCSMKYYWHALGLMGALLDDREFNLFVFSEDIEWCKQYFKDVKNVFFVQGFTSAEALLLMSECHHQILANSTFSWWAAWLNANSQKIVITPEIWATPEDLKVQHLIPDNWIKISN